MSASIAQKKKGRISTPRARTGCQTCRKRRVKCDETRPSCLKCVAAGWTCDGYILAAPTKSKDAIPALSIKRYALPFQIPGSQKDRKLLHYFCVRASEDLADFLDLDFWRHTVLEQSHREPTVRQALVSLSSLHLDCTTDPENISGVGREGTLQQYGKALRMLQRRLDTPDADAAKIALVCCILFHCFEATLGHNEAAMHHLKCGADMLVSFRNREGKDNEELDILSGELERLSLQSTLFFDQLVDYPGSEGEPGVNERPNTKPFRRLNDAHRGLVQLIFRGFHLLNNNNQYRFCTQEFVPATTLQDKYFLSLRMKEWKTAFESFRVGLSQDAKQDYGCRILDIQWHVFCMLLDAAYPVDATVFYSSPNHRAMHVLDLIDSALVVENTHKLGDSSASTPKKRIMTSSMGVIAPLFALTLKCSDQEVCDRAFEMLCNLQRREGLWQAPAMAGLIKMLRDARDFQMAQADEADLEILEKQSLELLFFEEISAALDMSEPVGTLRSAIAYTNLKLRGINMKDTHVWSMIFQ